MWRLQQIREGQQILILPSAIRFAERAQHVAPRFSVGYVTK
jgi:hypothetical protein